MKQSKEVKTRKTISIPADLDKLIVADPTFNLSKFVADELRKHFTKAKTLEQDKRWFEDLPSEAQDDLIWFNSRIKAQQMTKAEAAEIFEKNYKDKISEKDMQIIKVRVYHINPYKDIDVELNDYVAKV